MKSLFLYFVVYCVVNVVWSSALLAHEDTPIQIKDGALIGLPVKYLPAEFDTTVYRIRIGNHAMNFDPFLKSFFDQPHELVISASWYHEPEILPPYIALHTRPRKKDFSYEMLLNLDTLEVIYIFVVLHMDDSSTRDLPIALTDQWKKDIKKSIQTLK